LLTRRQKSAHGRVNRILIFSTISINGRLQSTPVSGQENRDRQVWVAGSTGHCNTALSLSAGVSNPKVFLGRWFRRNAIVFKYD
jgi:hypothetical protein